MHVMTCKSPDSCSSIVSFIVFPPTLPPRRLSCSLSIEGGEKKTKTSIKLASVPLGTLCRALRGSVQFSVSAALVSFTPSLQARLSLIFPSIPPHTAKALHSFQFSSRKRWLIPALLGSDWAMHLWCEWMPLRVPLEIAGDVELAHWRRCWCRLGSCGKGIIRLTDRWSSVMRLK